MTKSPSSPTTSSKGGIAHFLGLDAPPRALDLRFKLVPPNRRGTRPALHATQLETLLGTDKNDPDAFFATLVKQMRALNGYPVPAPKRFDLTEAVARMFFPVVLQLKEKHKAAWGRVPERDELRETSKRLFDAIQSLLISYQMVFEEDYKRSGFGYARARERIGLCAFRLFELIRLEQRMSALRFRALSEKSWLTLNTVYHALAAAGEDLHLNQPTLGSLLYGRREAKANSLQALYAAVQTFWILDPASWPSDVQFVIDEYLENIAEGVQITPYPDPEAKDAFIAQCWQNGPPARTHQGEEFGPASCISYRVLAKQVRQDYRGLVKARVEQNSHLTPRQLRYLPPAHQLGISHLMLNHLSLPRGWDGLQEGEPELRDLRLYVGLDQVLAHLGAVFGAGAQKQSRELFDMMAQNSAMIAKDREAQPGSYWYLLYESSIRLRLRTQETGYTNPLQLGSLLAYGFGDTVYSAPSIGLVSRLNRTTDGFVMLDVEQLANYAEPLRIKPLLAGAGSEDRPIDGILVHSEGMGWGLILPQMERIWEKDQLAIARTGGNATRVQLGKLREVSQELFLFSLRHKGDLPDSPESPARP